MEKCDVAVVGAGPAGAWTAYRLARGGARVVIFDPSHPREKPCGGGVTGRALDLVAPALNGGVPGVTIRTAAFERQGSAAVDVALPADRGSRPALVVASRAAFDAALLDAAVRAGAQHVPERVLDVAVAPGGVSLRTTRQRVACDWLVGADGATSLVRRRLHRPFARHQLSLAAGWFVDGATADSVVVRLPGDSDGYLWSFPRPDHLAVGACARADRTTSARLRDLVRLWILTAGVSGGAPMRAYSWPIPSLGAADLDRERPAGDRWLLTGDAAGLVDPITREGIYFALESAGHAAEAILGDAGRAAESYVARLRPHVVDELILAAGFTRAFFHPAFMPLLLHALERSARIRGVMADLVAGRQPYRTLKRRLLATFELGLAWRLLGPVLGRPAPLWPSGSR